MNKLLITIDDLTRLSSFDGNIDNDSVNPFIFMAQNAEIKRILGDTLYSKIVTDYGNDDLSGNYLMIYNDYISIILAYYSCYFYLQLAVAKVSQNGMYLVTPENTEQLSKEERESMSQKYQKLAVGLELRFIEILDELNLPERPAPNCGNSRAKSNFNWMKV